LVFGIPAKPESGKVIEKSLFKLLRSKTRNHLTINSVVKFSVLETSIFAEVQPFLHSEGPRINPEFNLHESGKRDKKQIRS